MAIGDIIMSLVVDDMPAFACGGCSTCHAAFGDTLEAAVSGVIGCEQCNIGPEFDFKYTWTGVNGLQELTWNGTVWTAVVGTLTKTTYETSDGTCESETGSEDTDITMTVACNPDNNALQIDIFSGLLVDGLELFTSNGDGTVGDAIPNVITDCAEKNPAENGTVTVTVP